MNIIDLIVFLVFTGGIVLMGSLFYRRNTSAKEFTNAGMSIPGWVVGMSIFSTYVSSISYLGNPGKSYADNWNPFVFGLSIPIACWIAARWFVPFYRRHQSVSAYAFLEERFGAWARIYASACYLLTQIARMGSILFLLAMPMNILMGWDLRTVIIVTSAAIIFYSMLGGMKAVIWTEAIQGFILIGGALVCLCVLLFSMPEGPMQAFQIGWESLDASGHSKFSFGSFSLTDLRHSTFWICLIYGIFINLQNYGIDQNYVQRYHTAKTEKEAKHAALFGGWLYIPVSALFFLIGTCLYSYYRVVPDAQVAAFEAAGKADYVFPYFMVHSLPHGLTGLLIASVFAAGMSTVATSVTSCSTIILTDYWMRLRRHVQGDKGVGDREHLVVLNGSSLLVGTLGVLVALALVNVDSILDAWWKLSSIFSGGMLGLFLLGYLSSKVKNIHALFGVLSGFAVIAWISAWEWLGLPDPGLHSYLAIVLGTMTIFVVGFAACLLFKKEESSPSSQEKRNKFWRKSTLIKIFACAFLATTVFVIGCNIAVKNAAKEKLYTDVDSIPFNRVGVLLGTNPTGRGDRPNIFYHNRIKACVDLYQAHKVERILVSGDNSHSDYDEPTYIKNDLIAAGVPDSIIYLDYAGFRTFDSMVRAKLVFGLDKFTIISQPFHNERALYISKNKGIDAIAFNAGDVPAKFWQVRMKIREWLARTKAVIDVHTGKRPHFLGEPITID
jgi:SSS family solute:Na+ symporter